MSKTVAVIGAGASGMMAAICAARAGAQVVAYERNDRVGKKILATGNGKCNFSNENMGSEWYYGSGRRLIDEVYKTFGLREAKAFFADLGMRMRNRNGCLYPASEQAATVLDVLRYEMMRLPVSVHTNQQVVEVKRHKGGFEVVTADRQRCRCDAVILCCGGMAAPKTGSDGAGLRLAEALGHRIVPTVPALTALRCKESFYKQIAGVRCDAGLALWVEKRRVCEERGELQLTDYGISGIPVFQMSRHAAYALREQKYTTVEIDFMPGYQDNEYERFWTERWARQKEQIMEQFVTGIVNKKISLLLLKLAGIKETERAADVSDARRERLSGLYRAFTVELKGTNSFDQAQVTAGGVDCREVTAQMESRLVPGLYFAGELLDVDGVCGGYNLQWAFSSGATAGLAAAGKTEAS
ncbi:MAG: aminoacetone oxidase family FAD-binding enzyme [Lachnospiraceae bacterium]|nr:aminoacetone oxidase family FAD-binding enzyme [Lachnospiraceae bacterium]